MLIPMRCFTCGKVLADKWNYYVKKTKEIEENVQDSSHDDIMFVNDKGHFNDLLNELGLTKICCRRHMLGHVDLIDMI